MANTKPPRISFGIKKIFDLLGPLIGLIIIIVLFSILEPKTFLTPANLGNVAGQILVVTLCAVGMTFVIVSGGIDLSVGSLIALSGITGTLALRSTGSVPIAILAAVGTGALCGFFNGLMITTLRLPPFIVTLGTLEIFRGAALETAGGISITNLPENFEDLTSAELSLGGLSIPYSFMFLLVFATLAWMLLRKTVFGVNVYAIGSNEQTARLCGIRVNFMKICVYTLGGLATGIAGILQASRLITGQPTVAVGRELDVIAAVVIGGGSLLGGEGTILGSLIGAALMGFLRNGCDLHGISPYVQRIVIGSIIIIAVFADVLRHRSSAKSGG